jgi:hypothetical protein
MKKLLEFSSLSLVLCFSLVFGFLGKPNEMALAIVAGAMAFALINLDKFSKIKGAGFEAELRDKIEAVIEKETETVLESGGATVEGYALDGDAIPVINALKDSKFTWRYPKGLVKESEVSLAEVEKTLNWLVDNGLARNSNGKHGKIWTLTTKGREAFLGEVGSSSGA